ncbi:ribonuclease III [Propioniferax innocua]|uniref:Ribonuclease 3 n=1 Tax=Propioniferax innocua TaxID=1753 RepID=A0A542ZPP4_9ACTN|nr:ribonuclease III [Propioniferax innocua]TQL62236.1 RNAse III [Propioniferax innocua]
MPGSELTHICSDLGVEIAPELLELALTHRSWAYENGGVPTNERLEFLGDAVLGVVMTDHLYRSHPDVDEGHLAKLRAAVVNARALADVARGLGVGPMIKLGRGEKSTGGHDKDSILADTMEAIIGAVYLSHGIEGAGLFVHRLFDPVAERAAALGAGLDWKTSLQEITAAAGLGVPHYSVTESGPDHDKRFEAWAVVADHRWGPGKGRSKKQAEQEAASKGFEAVQKIVAERGRSAADEA